MQPGPAAPTVETEETPGRKGRGIGRPFRSKGQVDPDALALARKRIEADESSFLAEAPALGRSPDWLGRLATRQGWTVPHRLRRKQREQAQLRKPSRGGKRRPKSAADRALARAGRATRLGIAILARELEEKIAAGEPPDEIAVAMSRLNKAAADARRNGLQVEGSGLPGDMNEQSAAAPPRSPEDMARLRAELAAAIADAVATHEAGPAAGEDDRGP